MLITNAKIITMDEKDYDNGYILIEGGKIISVGDMNGAPTRSEVFDAAGQYAIPSLIDAHCHLGLFCDGQSYETSDANEKTASEPLLKAADAVNIKDRCFKEAFEAGVAVAAVSPGSASVVGGQIAAVHTGSGRIINSCVAVKAALGDNPKNCGIKTRMGIAAELRKTLSEDNDIIRRVRNKEIPLHIHAHRACDILTAVNIAEEFDINIAVIHATEGYEVVEILKEKGISLMLGPLICDRSRPELAGLWDGNPAAVSEKDIPFAIITDHPEISSKYLLLSAQLAVKNGVDEKTALKAVTVSAAKILGLDNKYGKIAPGFNAEVLIFDKKPCDFMTNITKKFTSF